MCSKPERQSPLPTSKINKSIPSADACFISVFSATLTATVSVGGSVPHSETDRSGAQGIRSPLHLDRAQRLTLNSRYTPREQPCPGQLAQRLWPRSLKPSAGRVPLVILGKAPFMPPLQSWQLSQKTVNSCFLLASGRPIVCPLG